jgi:hypothetical protein
MNALLWVLQILLALYYIMGGIWMLAKVPKAWLNVLPKPAWTVLGSFQILFALGLVVPGAAGILPQATSMAAICVAVQTVVVAGRTTRMPGLLWALLPAAVALFVAYARLALLPL